MLIIFDKQKTCELLTINEYNKKVNETQGLTEWHCTSAIKNIITLFFKADQTRLVSK